MEWRSRLCGVLVACGLGLLLADRVSAAELPATEAKGHLRTVLSDDRRGNDASCCSTGGDASCSGTGSACGEGVGSACCLDEVFSALAPLKGVPLHQGYSVSYGGELRLRTMDEADRLRPGGPGRSTYELWRWRQWIDVKGEDWIAAHVEMLDASQFGEELPVTVIDVDRWDLYGAYVDLVLGELAGQKVTFRYGRQDLLYGSQHLVSPLDWGNTRRNFEGFKVMSKGRDWDVDLFATRPVNGAAGNIFRPESHDHADASRTFSGVYATCHRLEHNTFDLYWLWLREQEPVPSLPDGSRHTVGLRWAGTKPVQDACGQAARLWSWDVEGAYQFGHDDDAGGRERTVQAGFVSAMAGHTWTALPWKPAISGIYYWGSGDDDPADGQNNTFSVLFPLGHAYWGIIDNLAGQNLIDYAVQLSVNPTDKFNFVAAMHWFDLDSNADFLYNVAGSPVGIVGTGKEVGEELDLIATYTVHANFNVQVGYSWFWYGSHVENSPVSRSDATQIYVMTTLKY